MKHQLRLLLTICCCVFLLQTRAQPAGNLDPTFANGGIGKYAPGGPGDYPGSEARKVLLQADGKIVLAGSCLGSFIVTRVNADGTIDAGFGQNGTSYNKNGTNGNGSFGQLTSAVQQTDGKILLAGGGNNNDPDFSVIRLAANGNLDNSFGNNGKLLVPVGSLYDFANAIVLQTDGKILVAGYSYNGNDNDFSVVRLNSSGNPDSSFGNDGKLLIPMNGTNEYVFSMALQTDGKILLAGSSLGSGYTKILAVRLKSNGSLDSSFNGDGKLFLSVIGTYDYATSVALQPDGKILLGGNGYDGKHNDFIIVRLNSDASLDSSFDGDGKLTIHLTNADDDVNAMMLQPDGKILLAGYSNTGTNNSNLDNDFSIVRLNSNGSLDKSFDGDGKLILPVGSGEDVVRSIALQPNGKILLAGRSYNDSNGSYQDFSIVRLNSNGGLDSSFSSDGKLMIPAIGFVDNGNAVVLQPDNKILVAGDYSLMRLNNNGLPDNSFNGSGKLMLPLDNHSSSVRAMVLQPNGKIILAGVTTVDFNEHIWLFRVNSNGSLDSSFDSDGELLLPVAYNSNVLSMALQADGKILLAGNSNNDFLVIRLQDNGRPDTSFDGDGTLLIPVGSYRDFAYSVTVQGDGKILLAGSSDVGYKQIADFSVARLNINGTLDNSFGGDGKVLIPVSTADDIIYSTAVQPDGKILLAGYTDKKRIDLFSMVRLNNDGSLDSSFSSDGKFQLANAYVSAPSVTLQPDGKILMAGSVLNNGSGDFLVVRLNSSGNLDKSFGEKGKAIVDTREYNENARASVLQPDGKLVVVGSGEVDQPGTKIVAMRFLLCDNGTCPLPKIKINDASVAEGNSNTKNMIFSVTLSQASSQTVTVNYATQDGTAKSSSDYVAKSGTLTFIPGTTVNTISIKINGDNQPEPDENFKVNLSGAVNATIIDAKGIGTISNDDGTAIAAAASDLLQENNNQQSVKIYPKPASTALKVELMGHSGKVTLQFQNLEGKIFKQQELESTTAKYRQCQVDLTGVASGIYFLHVFDEHGKQHMEKVVVVGR